MDWGVGRYEDTAVELEPVAELVVSRAGISRGERVLDLGCGTGNVAAAAAAAGAEVVGVDPAARLLEVARERVPGMEFVQGTAEAIPLPEDAFDAVVSVFGVIFTPEPEAAGAEIARVLKPGGRALLTTWVPAGAVHEAFGAIGRALAEISGEEPRKPFGWGEPQVVRDLFARHGAQVEIAEERITFTAPSAEAWIEEGERSHPMMIPAKAALTEAGRYDDLRAAAIEALEVHRDPGDAFALTSRYLVVTVRA